MSGGEQATERPVVSGVEPSEEARRTIRWIDSMKTPPVSGSCQTALYAV